jgi:glycolate oxidase iron-sulfur subunit
MRLAKWFRDSGLAELAYETELFGDRPRFMLAVLLSSRPLLAKGRGLQPDRAGEPSGVRPPSNRSAAPRPGRTRVGVLLGCVMEGLFAETNRATERVLERNGCDLVEVRGQVCCGALQAHAGHLETAKELAKRNIKAFLDEPCEAIVVNSAGCGAAMKEYKDWLADDPDFAGLANTFSTKVQDVSEFLMGRGLAQPSGQVNLLVTYDAPCHLLHAQRVVTPPVELLKAIPGLRFRPLAGAETCCGGAGIYNLQHPQLSAEILSGKLDNIKNTGADVVATANPGCIMQIGAGAKMAGLDVAVAHPIELLDAAYRKAKA